jgi:acetoin utilization deacetylase AcuC-like enzyme
MSTSTNSNIDDDQIGIALTRPPGHHATHSEANGFCFLNFAMAAAFYVLQKQPGIKISILDFDVHFGQGIADILEKCSKKETTDNGEDWTSNIRYVSLHQVPAYPYSGQSRKTQFRSM